MDAEQIAIYVIAILVSQVGIAFLYDWLFRRRNRGEGDCKPLLDKMANGEWECDKHAKIDATLNMLKEAHNEENMIDKMVKAIKKANSK